ncbi:15147_t:CDS:2 [Funneliformis geosporum]|uniref:4646_t:CDS:1 n=1 Tax=Funneliformis geosporum TaxID=1117311 RepID=A0A9W4WY70_9GLOM|nr:15147_t:CDS:2 [Funneliformis geosporum]CAI2187987.1 4646_t:CDS:2 [Funneliformis geosporum]
MEGRQQRTFIKNKSQHLCKDSFKKWCLKQFKRSRETQVNKHRFGLNLAKVTGDYVNVIHEEILLQFIKNEWMSFLMNEDRFTGDLNPSLASEMEEELLQEFKNELQINNSRDLEEAEYALQYEPEEIFQDSDMMILDEYSLNLDNTHSFGGSQG